MSKISKYFLRLSLGLSLILGIFPVFASECTYTLTTSDQGIATINIKRNEVKIKIKDARPNTMYTVWNDFKNRASGQLADDYPLDKGAIGRGVAPTFASTAGVTAGMGLDPNSFVTDEEGDAFFRVKLDYKVLVEGASPVVGGELAMQGMNRVGGYWLRKYDIDPNTAASLQMVDPNNATLPLLERATIQGFTIQYHPDFISHGHTPGVGGVDHFGAFKGDIPASC
ncbi:MAG: hypothetical protein GXP19_06350 [Gammaproteobacteria bacterium]|nr:hypothetical protein [Gammaproteobacteria bacterium]